MLASQLPDGGVVLSGSVSVFEGARAAVLQADGLFRLDVVVVPDSLRILVRNLSGAQLRFEPDGYPRPVAVQGTGLAERALKPGHHEVSFRLGDSGAKQAVEVRVTLATLRGQDGVVRVTAHAVARAAQAVAA